MAMTGPGLSAAIKALLVSRGWVAPTSTELQQFCDDLGNAIVLYVTTNAIVVPTSMVAPLGGGAVTGVGTVT